jgi:hypothetical protein
MGKAQWHIQMVIFLRELGVAVSHSAGMATYITQKAGSMREASCGPCGMVRGSAHGLLSVCATRESGEF